MALIRCSECGKEISDKASVCINCGCPVSVSVTVPTASNNTPAYLSVNFNAVLAGADNDKTYQCVYVNELKRNVDFYLDNDTVTGDVIKIDLIDKSKYEYILFKAVSVTKKQSADSDTSYSAAQERKKAISNIKCYDRNNFGEFLHSRHYMAILFPIIVVVIKIAAESNYDPDMITVGIMSTAFVWLPLLLARIFYPMHHIKKYFKKYKINDAIRKDVAPFNVAIAAYNTKPGTRMLSYIRSLNADAAQKIKTDLSKRK